MAADKKDIFRSEVTERLSSFFEEKDPSATGLPEKNTSASQDSPLLNLNAILLSIEWEITDEILSGLISEIDRLKDIYHHDKIVFSFLQLHGSVGQYIRTKKVTAHPDSIKLLHSVYSSLEKVVSSPEMSETQKKQLLSEEVQKFKLLKELILIAKKDASRIEETEPPAVPSPSGQTKEISPQKPEARVVSEDLLPVLEEIRKTIKAEFEILKEELKVLVNDLHHR